MNKKETLNLVKTCIEYFFGNRKLLFLTQNVDGAHIVLKDTPFESLRQSYSQDFATSPTSLG